MLQSSSCCFQSFLSYAVARQCTCSVSAGFGAISKTPKTYGIFLGIRSSRYPPPPIEKAIRFISFQKYGWLFPPVLMNTSGSLQLGVFLSADACFFPRYAQCPVMPNQSVDTAAFSPVTKSDTKTVETYAPFVGHPM